MSEPAVEHGPISYAHRAPQIALDVRPSFLLIPNLAAVVTIFLKLTGSESPFDALLAAIRARPMGGGHFWDGVITAPFLLALPLAIWTARLCVNPFVQRSETIVAWCISLTSMAMTMMAIGYCVYLLHSGQNFYGAIVAASISVCLLGISLWKLRALMSTYVPPLVAMTGSFAINTLFTVLIILHHSKLTVPVVLDLAIPIAQLVVMVALVRRYRREMRQGSI